MILRATVFAAVLAFAAASSAAAGDSLDVAMGKALFDRPWVTAPSATRADDGLGPLYVARACVACHPRAGRGVLPPAGLGAVLRLGDDPVYGRQLQPSAVAGHAAEGRLELREEKHPFRYPDGRTAALRRLVAAVADPAFGPVTAPASLRLAPSLRGLGLLERTAGGEARFGWKAEHPDIPHQSAAAFHLDIGMSSPLYPEPWGDCTAAQTACRGGPHGDNPATGEPEISAKILDLIVTYLRALPPPAPAPADPAGEASFAATGCADCHHPRARTDDGRDLAPYSDMRLHDMGPELADEVAAGATAGNFWRTPPLWGLRDAPKDAAGNLALLHDGRARTVEEAVLWHGGAAEAAKRRFTELPAAEREALLRFVGAL